MKKQGSKTLLVIGGLLSVGLFFHSIFRVIPQIARSRDKLVRIQEEIHYLEEKNESYLEKIDAYTENIAKLNHEYERERIARNRLQMIKEGEVIYRLKQNK